MTLHNHPAIFMNCYESSFIYKNKFVANFEKSQSLPFLMNMSKCIRVRPLLSWKKTQTRNLAVFMVLMVFILWPSSTLKFLFVFFLFQLMSLSNLFLKLGKFLVSYLCCDCITFNFTTQMTLRHLLPMAMNKKVECKDHQIYCKMLRKICKKSNFSFIRVIKNSSTFWSTFSMVKSFLQILWWHYTEPLLAIIPPYCVRYKIFWLCQC